MAVPDIPGNSCRERGPTVAVDDTLHPNIGYSKELPFVVSSPPCPTSYGHELHFKQYSTLRHRRASPDNLYRGFRYHPKRILAFVVRNLLALQHSCHCNGHRHVSNNQHGDAAAHRFAERECRSWFELGIGRAQYSRGSIRC